MAENVAQELVLLNQRLLESIAAGDWATYAKLCDPSLTCFEPEALGHLVHGLDFHHYYFENRTKGGPPVQNTICAPHVRLLGDVAIVSFVRLVQKQTEAGAVTVQSEETRVWHRRADGWRHVHLHRSLP